MPEQDAVTSLAVAQAVNAELLDRVHSLEEMIVKIASAPDMGAIGVREVSATRPNYTLPQKPST